MISVVFLFILLFIAWPLISWKGYDGDDVDDISYAFLLVLWFACMAYGYSAEYIYANTFVTTSEIHRSNYDKDDYVKQGTNNSRRTKDRGQNVSYSDGNRIYR